MCIRDSIQADTDAADGADTIFNCWNAVYRATGRVEGIERRIKSGKGFKNEGV